MSALAPSVYRRPYRVERCTRGGVGVKRGADTGGGGSRGEGGGGATGPGPEPSQMMNDPATECRTAPIAHLKPGSPVFRDH